MSGWEYVHGPYWYGWKDLGIPEAGGVYFLSQGEEIVYVGRSANLSARIKNHPFAPSIRSGETTVGWCVMPLDDAMVFEREYILHFKPKANLQVPYPKGHNPYRDGWDHKRHRVFLFGA